ncbi:hypothetical protein [Streptomyces sp. NPDC058335]|uniref:hypothetical protein n=1 Tax=Streptomyces sp. NPDC058335 TaxID=3346451 RepID=UPI00364B4E10
MTQFARGFKLHLRGGQVLDGVEFPSGRALVVDDPEGGLVSAAISVEELLKGYHRARIEWPAEEAEDQPPAPPTNEGADLEQTARLFAALHSSAEQDVTRVIALYERWVQAGAPPLGTSMSRWWDARLVELHNAILPPSDQPEEQ